MDQSSNHTSDSKIICFMIPYDQRKSQTQNICSILSDMSSSSKIVTRIKESNSSEKEPIYEERNTDNVPMRALNYEYANDSKQLDSNASSEILRSQLKRKSKYSDIYDNGNLEFIRRDPKYARKNNRKFQEPRASKKSEGTTEKSADKVNQFGCKISIEHSSKRMHTNEMTSCRDDTLNDPKQSTDNACSKQDVKDEERDVQFVHQLINFLTNPKTKYHQDFAITILRHDEKLLKIFQRERHALKQKKIPVFRPKKQTEFVISNNAKEQYFYHLMQDERRHCLDQVSMQTRASLSSSLRSPTTAAVSTISSAGSATSLDSDPIEILPFGSLQDNSVEQCQSYNDTAINPNVINVLSAKQFYTVSDDAVQSSETSLQPLQKTGSHTDSLCLNLQEEREEGRGYTPSFSPYLCNFN